MKIFLIFIALHLCLSSVFAQVNHLWDTVPTGTSYRDFDYGTIGSGLSRNLNRDEEVIARKEGFKPYYIKIGKWVYKDKRDTTDKVRSVIYYNSLGEDSIVINYNFKDSLILFFRNSFFCAGTEEYVQESRYVYSFDGSLIESIIFITDSLLVRTFWLSDSVQEVQLCSGSKEHTSYETLSKYVFFRRKE